MYPNLSIGPASIPSYPLLVLLALWAGMWLGAKEAERLGLDGDHIYNIGLYGLLAGLLGGRAWYVLTHWEAYAKNAIQALALTINAIALPEAFVFALAAIIIYIKVHKLPLALVADAIAPGAALAMVIGGVGAFLGSQTLGTPTSLPWGIEQFERVRHPAHLYQVIAGLIILVIIWKVRLNPRWPGFTFLLFVFLYAAGRLILDPFFALPVIVGPGLRQTQLIALATMVATLAVMAFIDTGGTDGPAGK